ncbi:MAG: metalloregulator ArsR/SmtB family transcription factor [Pseudomonadales bacterium]
MAAAEPHNTTVQSSRSASSATLAAFNKAAGDELRLEILRVLHRDSYGVLELASIFDMRQSGMSHHLKVLANAGLVSRRREGNSIFYSRSHQAPVDALSNLQQHLLQLTDDLVLPSNIEQRLADIREQRATHSRSFFEQHSGEFSRHQEQISEFSVYASPVAHLLDSLAEPQRDSVLEIGPGTGQFLGELAQRFNSVFALDNSREMLDAARASCLQNPLIDQGKIEFIHGDTSAALQRGLRVDTVVVNMVLHHLASPAELVRDINDLLCDGGQLIIAELCAHDQDWVRESCGDLWLGIAPETLSEWTNQYELNEIGSGQYLSLRNGFQLQIRQFSKTISTTWQ